MTNWSMGGSSTAPDQIAHPLHVVTHISHITGALLTALLSLAVPDLCRFHFLIESMSLLQERILQFERIPAHLKCYPNNLKCKAERITVETRRRDGCRSSTLKGTEHFSSRCSNPRKLPSVCMTGTAAAAQHRF